MADDQVREVMGTHEAASLAGPNMVQNLAQLAEFAPTLSKAITEDGFGSALASATIGYREWNLLVLAMLSVMGDTADQSQIYLQAAVEHGATEQELTDILNLVHLYAGAPRAVNAARHMSGYLQSAQQRLVPGSVERVIHLRDHDTMIWDSQGKGVPSDNIPMILVHALDMDHRFWREVFPTLTAQGRVVAYDIRGHGRARGAPLTKDLYELADDLSDLLDQLGVDIADVYGASYGGSIVQYFALKYPQKARSMALLATGAKAPQAELAARAYDAEHHGMEAQVARSCVRWFHPESLARDLWMVRYARNCVRRSRPQEWAAAWRAMSALNIDAELAKDVQCPVLVLSGTEDLSATPEIMKEILPVYKHSEFVSIEKGTHMMPMEDPESTAKALAQFRNKVDEMYRLQKGRP